MITHLLDQIPYREVTRPPIEIPPRPEPRGYVRPPIELSGYVPDRAALLRGDAAAE